MDGARTDNNEETVILICALNAGGDFIAGVYDGLLRFGCLGEGESLYLKMTVKAYLSDLMLEKVWRCQRVDTSY